MRAVAARYLAPAIGLPHCGTPRAGNAMSQRLLALTRAGCAARAGLTARLAVY